MSSTQLSPAKLQLDVDLDSSRVDRFFSLALRRLGQRVRVAGFRPGHAPADLVERQIGYERVQEEALTVALSEVLPEAYQLESVAPLGRPRIKVVSFSRGQPAHFEATVSVAPPVELPALELLDVQRPHTVVSETDVEAQIERLLEPFSSLESVDRPIAEGDVVSAEVVSWRDGEDPEAQEAEERDLEVREGGLLAELRQALVGKSATDVVETELTVAADDPDPTLAGQRLWVRMSVRSVKERNVPELDDALAGQIGDAGQFNSAEELRSLIRERLESRAAEQDALALRTSIAERLVEACAPEAPEALVERELELRQDELLAVLERGGLGFDRFLASAGMTTEQWLERARPRAEFKVAVDLILDAVAASLEVGVDPKVVERSVAQLLDQQGVRGARRAQLARSQNIPSVVTTQIRRQLAMDRLAELYAAKADVSPAMAAADS